MSPRGAAQVLAKQVMGPELLLCASRSRLQTGTVLPRLVPLLIGCLPLYLLESWMLQSVAGRLKHGDGHPSEVHGACRIDHIVCLLSSRICLCLKLFVYERNSFQLQMSFLTFSLSFETFLVPVFDFFFVLLPASNDEDRDRDFF